MTGAISSLSSSRIIGLIPSGPGALSGSCLAFFIRENNFYGANFCLSETVSMLPSSSLRPSTD